MFWGFRLILLLRIECFLQNHPENVLKVFLKLFLKIKYCIDFQQMKSMCKHNILHVINSVTDFHVSTVGLQQINNVVDRR